MVPSMAPTISTRRLGSTGTLVSELCLGTMTFGKEADEDASHRILDHYVGAGGNFLDTANVYNDGVFHTFWGEDGREEEVVPVGRPEGVTKVDTVGS